MLTCGRCGGGLLTPAIAAGWLTSEVLIPAFADPGVAWLGHLGGFLSGGIIVLVFGALGLPRPRKPGARRPRSSGSLRRALDRATDWISERPAVSIPLLGVSAIGVLLLSVGYTEHRECDALRARAARALREYADRVEANPPTDELEYGPTPAEARARAAEIEDGEHVDTDGIYGHSHDLEANRLLHEAQSILWRYTWDCRF